MPLSSRRLIIHLVGEHRRAAVVTQRYTVAQGEEQAVVISIREYNRLIERLEASKQSGWADLWLAGAGAGVAVAMGALVGALTLPGGDVGDQSRALGGYRLRDDRPAPVPIRLFRSAARSW